MPRAHVSLAQTWRGLGDTLRHTSTTRRILRGVVVIGALPWFVAMAIPFL